MILIFLFTSFILGYVPSYFYFKSMRNRVPVSGLTGSMILTIFLATLVSGSILMGTGILFHVVKNHPLVVFGVLVGFCSLQFVLSVIFKEDYMALWYCFTSSKKGYRYRDYKIRVVSKMVSNECW